jgi:hypothetical protein
MIVKQPEGPASVTKCWVNHLVIARTFTEYRKSAARSATYLSGYLQVELAIDGAATVGRNPKKEFFRRARLGGFTMPETSDLAGLIDTLAKSSEAATALVTIAIVEGWAAKNFFSTRCATFRAS